MKWTKRQVTYLISNYRDLGAAGCAIRLKRSRECVKAKAYLLGLEYQFKGFYINNQGYKLIKIDGVFIMEHRYLMEAHLGRSLKPNEVVHHINHDRLDNRIKNLVVMTLEAHNYLHKFLGTGQWKKKEHALIPIEVFI